MNGAFESNAWRSMPSVKHVQDRRQGVDRIAIRLRHAFEGLRGASADFDVAREVCTHSEHDGAEHDAHLRERAASCARAYALGQGDDRTLIESLRVIRELAHRTLGLKMHPVQVAAASAMVRGRFVELATGEGKTLVATAPAIIAAWRGHGCHVLTTNDYLVTRDRDRNHPLFDAVGLVSACVTGTTDRAERRVAYQADITYTTAKEACADHLRDRLLARGERSFAGRVAHALVSDGAEGVLQRGLACAIVDEADSVLIDEATTPLILSSVRDDLPIGDEHARAATVATMLELWTHYTIRESEQSITLTRAGRARIASVTSGWGGLWTGRNRAHELVLTALRAAELFERDREYLVREQRVVIIDPFTGRTMPDRTWRHALHQAVEAKEGLEPTAPPETTSSLSFQRFFARYERLCGMSGTLREVAPELRIVYGAHTITLPTHHPLQRSRARTVLFVGSERRWAGVVSRIQDRSRRGQPVLVGTRSVRSSERLAAMLRAKGIAHQVLNAHRDDEEARVIARAGHAGSVTIATSMAGRGTDIQLDAEARGSGGLHVIVAEMHDSERVDRQLLGRAGRQGDPGSGEVMGSLEDELLTRYAPAPLRKAALRCASERVPVLLASTIVRRARSRAQGRARGQRARLRDGDLRLDDALAFAGTPD